MSERALGPEDSLLAALLEDLLHEQQDLTAVARFAELHEAAERDGTLDELGTGPGGRYHALLPATPPAPHQQLAFEVDLDACTGCKACVTGCTNLNGLDADEGWRTVGRLGLQHVTAACHHCAEPACSNGCPAKAYTKDLFTGAVVHLDDACIGCGYCTMTCPYEVPVMNERLGIVRKCDLCHDRLAEGEPPACVQACPTEAIRITVVDKGTVDWGLTAGPDPRLTSPSTRYVGSRPLPPTSARPTPTPKPAHGHPALAGLLVLSQSALGAVAVGHAWVGLALLLAASAASVLHLGRPLLAWRAILGWKRSWLSREVLAIGAATPLVALAAIASTPERLPSAIRDVVDWAAFATPLRAGASGALVAAVFCSAALYVVTRRRPWRAPLTAPRFGLTALAAAAALGGPPWALLPVVAAQLGLDVWAAVVDEPSNGRLLQGPLRREATARVLLALVAVACAAFGLPTPTFIAVVATGLIERGLWFRAVPPTAMPR